MADGGQPVAGGSGANNVTQNQNVIINPAAQNAAAQLAQQILANTNVMLKQEIIKFPKYLGEKVRTLSLRRSSFQESMNVMFPMIGTTQQLLPIFDSVFVVKQKNGSILQSGISN
jgi:hypothetical protein